MWQQISFSADVKNFMSMFHVCGKGEMFWWDIRAHLNYCRHFLPEDLQRISKWFEVSPVQSLKTVELMSKSIYLITTITLWLLTSNKEVCFLAGLRKNYWTDFHKTWWKIGRERTPGREMHKGIFDISTNFPGNNHECWWEKQ